MIADFCSYNIRGLHNKVSFAKDFLSLNKFGIAALLETHVKKEDAFYFSSIIAPRFKWLFNYDFHDNGRIWLGWDETLWQVSLVGSSSQHITCEVKHSDGLTSCLLTMIYAHNDGITRRLLWSDLIAIQQRYNSSNNLIPWCLMGDFNIFLNPSETSGALPRKHIYINEFRDCINELGLTDLRSNGNLYTWWDGNIQNPLMRKLDRVLVNEAWLKQFDFALADFLPRGVSDHNPAVVNIGIVRDVIHKPFQLFKHLMEDENFMEAVKQAWEPPVSGNKWFKVTTKLKRVKLALKDLNRNRGNLHENVIQSRNELIRFQSTLPLIPSPPQRLEEGRLSSRLQSALYAEEKLLKQKSRIRWLKEGDGNNRYFFNSCKGRWNSNKILSIQDDEGNSHSGQRNIASIAVSYFENLLGNSGDVEDFSSWPEIQDLKRLNEDDKINLVRPFTTADVLATFKSMASGKSPGPDGFPPEFFVKSWKIVGSDVSAAILQFFETGMMPKTINSSAISLIPKHPNANHMSHFRPISCCNAIHKCIGKMLALRMSTVMASLVSLNQTAFVPSRSMGDNVLLAQALCRNYHLNNGPARIACKLDIRKAFDTLNWSFIFKVLVAMNFPGQFIDWLRVCVTTCMHSVKVNGALEGYFAAESGLRQGDPLSPYLFVLGMEVLNVCFARILSRSGSEFSYHWRCSSQKLTHLVFADDLMVFCKGNLSSFTRLFEAISLFSSVSGLHLSTSKCYCFFGNVSADIKASVLSLSGFNEGALPITYLGLPLISKNLNTRDCQPLITKITKRIELWTNKFISQGGRLQLIDSILTAVQSYWARFLFFPAKIVKRLSSIFAKYLWAGNLDGKCVYKVAWSDCCYPKIEGGLGLKNLHFWNEAAVLYQLWRIVNRSESLWIQWLYKYELKKKGFWTMSVPAASPWSWRVILNSRSRALNFIKYQPGISSSFLLWHDPWMHSKPLLQQYNNPAPLISALESHSHAQLHTIIRDGEWNMGVSNFSLVRDLRYQCEDITLRSFDRIIWDDGGHFQVTLSTIYHSIAPHSSSPAWLPFVWSKFRIAKHSLTAWLIMKGRLFTKDRMSNFHLNVDPTCILCGSEFETHQHLFCDYNFSRDVLNASPGTVSMDWGDMCEGRMLTSNVDDCRTNIMYLYVAAAFYYIWKERNIRIHNPGQYNSSTYLISQVISGIYIHL